MNRPTVRRLRRARRSLPLGLRADAVELLDGGRLSLPEVERNLADLARLNRLPGGTAASVDGVRRLLANGRTPASSTSAPGAATCRSPSRARGWATTALDRNPDVLIVAARRDRGGAARRGRRGRCPIAAIRRRRIRRHPLFAAVHHFDPAEAVAVLRELRRVARHGRRRQRPSARAPAAARDRRQRRSRSAAAG